MMVLWSIILQMITVLILVNDLESDGVSRGSTYPFLFHDSPDSRGENSNVEDSSSCLE